MAIDLTLKSTAIANREATPRVLNDPGLGEGGTIKTAYGYLASVTAALSIGSIIRLVSIPSNAIVLDVQLVSAVQAVGSFDIGLYRNNADGGAVIDADFFAVAVDCSGVVSSHVLNQSETNTIELQGGPIWDAFAAFTKDPCTTFDVCATVASADVTTGTGSIGLRVRYVDGG